MITRQTLGEMYYCLTSAKKLKRLHAVQASLRMGAAPQQAHPCQIRRWWR